MKPYRPTSGSKFWVQSGKELIPVSKKDFVTALHKQEKTSHRKRKD